jgi:hypothetical protein
MTVFKPTALKTSSIAAMTVLKPTDLKTSSIAVITVLKPTDLKTSSHACDDCCVGGSHAGDGDFEVDSIANVAPVFLTASF